MHGHDDTILAALAARVPGGGQLRLGQVANIGIGNAILLVNRTARARLPGFLLD
jgi:hypothetical protein